MVCLAGLGVLPRYYCSRAPLPLSPVSKGNPTGEIGFSFENQKPRFKMFFVYGALFRECFPATSLPGFFIGHGAVILFVRESEISKKRASQGRRSRIARSKPITTGWGFRGAL